LTDELQQIKEKLDLIINYFHIGQAPVRSIRDLEREAESKIIQLQNRPKRIKRKNVRETV